GVANAVPDQCLLREVEHGLVNVNTSDVSTLSGQQAHMNSLRTTDIQYTVFRTYKFEDQIVFETRGQVCIDIEPVSLGANVVDAVRAQLFRTDHFSLLQSQAGLPRVALCGLHAAPELIQLLKDPAGSQPALEVRV